MLSAMLQEHERSAGNWHAEWEVLTEIMLLTAGSLEKTIDLLAGLEVDEKRMLANIEITQGLIFAENVSLALASKIGKIQAHELVEKACKTAVSKNKHLKEILIENNVEIENLDELFNPENSIGNSVEIVESILKKI
jgi:3-carboxy-cis,cis-muconate cycloisomerase